MKSHAPHGACELKLVRLSLEVCSMGHAPHGACELKCNQLYRHALEIFVTLPTERVS